MLTPSKNTQRAGVVSLVCVAVFIAWLPQLQTLHPGTSYGDEGVVASAAWRIYNGEVPYRDFFSALTPGSSYWVAAFFKFFGPTFLALRLSVLATASMILLSSVWVTKKLKVEGSAPYLLVISFLAFFGGPYWFVASHHWLTLACSLFSFAFYLCPGNGNDRRWTMLAAGGFAALAACTMQHKGVLWMLLASFGLLTLPQRQRKQALLWFWCGVLLISLPVILWFIEKAGFPVLFEQLIEFPLTRYNKIEGHQGVVFEELLRNWINVLSAWGGQSSWFDWLQVLSWNLGYLGRVIVHVLPLMATAALAYLWKSAARDRFILGGLTAFLVAMYLAVIYRPSETTLVFAAPAALFVLVVVVDILGRRNLPKTGRVLRATLLWGWLVVFGGTAAGFSAMEAFVPKVTTETPVGPINSLYPREAQDLAGVTTFMAEHIQPGEPVFCYNYVAFFYFLLQVKNPTPFDILTYPMNTLEQLHQAQFLLEKNQCRWVVYDFAPFYKESLGRFLLLNYEVVKRFNSIAILKRRTPFRSTPRADTGLTQPAG